MNDNSPECLYSDCSSYLHFHSFVSQHRTLPRAVPTDGDSSRVRKLEDIEDDLNVAILPDDG
jgi:hypothetical protein